MGYPAFIQPSNPLTAEAIEADPQLRELAKNSRTRQQLLDGNPGEEFWHSLPDHLRVELEAFVANYSVAESELDPPCFWLDMNTRLCKHHEQRPRVCRDFAVGSRVCREWRDHYGNHDAAGDAVTRTESHFGGRDLTNGPWISFYRGDARRSIATGIVAAREER